ncbi:TonB-dependent receptor [Massilia sp. Dwa41.01b]|uniref:TonB-dependent receptor n=1 Tax=unclassified Massilia TaxID=2609279 RepID=UPI0015FF5C78|nr:MULTISPECIES: TonB-dependent receptor [unclassified Massilia]QNA88163.1 TonB-dependent receptor [Massilia sp. Dwa41.01b]QNA99069.1 TonB-dependent receptor [Massilia sp. Se16.2.3]
MTFKLKSMPHAIAFLVATGALAGMSPAMAQQQETPAMQRVVVTGSLISRTDTETPAPVQVLSAADIQKSGKTSVAELLTDLAANGAGTLGTGFSGAFANGASGVSLRGLTVGATLVLIDGRRMAPYPLSDDSQRSFVDVSSIPFDAIESIEVLKAGASATYGSDAIAGVVNIKLKKNLTGTRVSAEVGTTQHGGGQTKRASASTGIGDLDTDGYNAFITAEWRKQNPIMVADRDQFGWANRDWRSRGGNNLTLGVPTNLNNGLVAANSPFLFNTQGAGGATNPANFQFLDPKCNYTLYRAGGCAIRDEVTFIQPPTENVNVMIGMTKKLSDDWQIAFKGSLFKRDSLNNRGVPLTYSPNSFNGNTTLINGVLTGGVNAIPNTRFAPGAPVGANVINSTGGEASLYGYIPGIATERTSDNTSTSTRFAVDLKGRALGWDIDAGIGATRVKTEVEYLGYVNRPALYNAINNGTWNVLGNNSPALIAQVSPNFSNTLTSTLNYADLIGTRELMQLGAGPLAIAAGVHWHERKQNAPPSSLTANGLVASTSPFTIGDETNSAVFAQLQANPIKNLEVTASGRYDHFDTYGNSFTPSAGFKWSPLQQIGVRGTFARGFRAPNPAEVGNAGSFFTFNNIDDPILCADGTGTRPGDVPLQCDINPPYVQTTSQNLEPEKSKSYTLGLILEPVRGLNMSLDYYNIEVKNLIVTRAGNDPTFVPTWIRGAAVPTQVATGNGDETVLGTPAVGPILYAASPYINAGSTKTHGIEADVRYKWRLANDMGTLSANLTAAHTFGYESEVAGTTFQLAGTQGPSVVGGATGNPKNRAQFTLGWNRGPLDVTTTVNYTSGFSTLDPSVGGTSCSSSAGDVGGRSYFARIPGGQPLGFCDVASFTTTNLNVQYKLSDNLTLRAAVLNLFDREPPYDVATYGNANAQTSYNASLHQAGAVGRFFSLGLAYQF